MEKEYTYEERQAFLRKMDERLKKVNAVHQHLHDLLRFNVTPDNCYDVEQALIRLIDGVREALGVEKP